MRCKSPIETCGAVCGFRAQRAQWTGGETGFDARTQRVSRPFAGIVSWRGWERSGVRLKNSGQDEVGRGGMTVFGTDYGVRRHKTREGDRR